MKKKTASHIHFHQNMTDITHTFPIIVGSCEKMQTMNIHDIVPPTHPPTPQVRVQITVTNFYPCGMC